MENKIDNKLDSLLKQVGVESIHKQPAQNFTDTVMQRIAAEASLVHSTTYKPLISKKIGALIVATILIGFGYIAYSNPETSNWLPALNFSKFNVSSLIESFTAFQVSSTFFYAFLFLGIMLVIQISLLKKRHNRRWNLK